MPLALLRIKDTHQPDVAKPMWLQVLKCIPRETCCHKGTEFNTGKLCGSEQHNLLQSLLSAIQYPDQASRGKDLREYQSSMLAQHTCLWLRSETSISVLCAKPRMSPTKFWFTATLVSYSRCTCSGVHHSSLYSGNSDKVVCSILGPLHLIQSTSWTRCQHPRKTSCPVLKLELART